MPRAKDPSTAAKELSKLGAPKGGRARANLLSPEERSAQSKRAAQARWAKAGKSPAPETAPKVVPVQPDDTPPYSMFRGTLQIGDSESECHVLSDDRRVLTQREVVRLLSGGRESGNLSRYLARIPGSNAAALADRVVEFRIPGGPPAIGYEGETLVEVCEMYLTARAEGLLRKDQMALARTAEAVVRACAKVGIVALIDEATGYQEVRAKRALQVKLQAFIADEIGEWAKMFPDEFWYELARLEGTRYSPRNRPLRWGKYVMAFVYDAIDGDVGKALRERNPNPHHRQNHHQWLKDFGREKVNDQIQRVIAVMKTCDDMPQFRARFDRVFQRGPLQLRLEGGDWSDMAA